MHATIANFAFFGMLFAVPQYFQSVEGISPLGTGIRLLPMALGLVIGTQLGGPELPGDPAAVEPCGGRAAKSGWLSALSLGVIAFFS